MLLFFDSGGDHGGLDAPAKFSEGTATISSGGRNSTQEFTTAGLRKYLPDASGSTVVVGFGFKPPSLSAVDLVQIVRGTEVQGTLSMNVTTGTLYYRRGATTLGTTVAAMVAGTYAYVELKVAIDDAAGTVDVWINGASALALTAQDTQDLSDATWNGVKFATGEFDDVYVLDASGGPPWDDRLGNSRVAALIASGTGAHAEMTPSTGVDHDALVDDATPNGDTDYNKATGAARDSYTFGAPGGSGTIHGVQVLGYARKFDATYFRAAPFVRVGGIDYDGAAQDLSQDYRYVRSVFPVNPATGLAWTADDVAAGTLEAGIAVEAPASPTRFYLQNRAAPYTPATIRGAWDQTAGAVTKALDPQKVGGGDIASVAIAETSATDDFDVLLGRWVSGPLDAQTLSGTVDVCIGISESDAAANLNWHLHVYVTQGDSDTPRGTILSNYRDPEGSPGNEWPTTIAFKALASAQALTGLAVSAGDRLVVEIGSCTREAAATSRTSTLKYGTSATAGPLDGEPVDDGAVDDTDVDDKAGYVDFSNGIALAGEARLSQMVVEVIRSSTASVAGWSHQIIEYVGDGVNDRLIETAFPLDSGRVAIFIYQVPASPSEVAEIPVVRISAFADTYVDGVATEENDCIKTLTADGFTVGADNKVNETGELHIAVVLRDSSVDGDFMRLGTYIASGVDDAVVTVEGGFGFQPTHVWIVGKSHVYRSVDFVGDKSITFTNEFAGASPNLIQSFFSDGFIIGANGNVNFPFDNYGYIALRATGIEGFFSFKGVGTSGDDAISGAGFTPGFVVAKYFDTTTPTSTWSHYRSTNSHTGDDSQRWVGPHETTGAGVKSIDADGATFGANVAPNGEDFYGYMWSGLQQGGGGVDIQKATQFVIEVAEDEDADAPPAADPCAGGGTVASGTNPSDGASLATATAPHVWMEGTIGATTYRWAKTAINIGASPKTPRVLSFGQSTRACSDGRGGFESASLTVTLADVDRVLRDLHATATLLNVPFDFYVQDEASIRAGGTPWHVARLVVREFEPLSDLTYRMTFEDALTLSFSAFAQETLVPKVLISSAISDATPYEQVKDKPVPLLYGSLSDEEDDEPRGTVPAPYVTANTPAEHEELGNIYRFLVGLGAIADIQSVFIADEFSGTPPTARAKASESLYGDQLWAPHMPDWLYGDDYEDVGGHRYTFVYLDQAHPAAELARTGRIPLAVNLCGRETDGDGTGSTIDSLPLQLLHFLNNEVVQQATEEWLPIKALGSYSLFDTASFVAAQNVSEDRIAGGYKGAFVLGHGLRQIPLWTAIGQFCRSSDLDIFVNRHGQVAVTMLDRTATASGAPLFTDVDDIVRDSFRIDPKTDEVENKVPYVYRRNYVPALQQLNPKPGERLPREPYDGVWLSGLQSVSDGTSIAAIGETREAQLLELEMVRDEATADDVAEQRLALRRNPRPVATFALRLNRGLALELGDIVKVTHFQGLGDEGWLARRCQVRRLTCDLDRLTVTVTVRDVEDLLA